MLGKPEYLAEVLAQTPQHRIGDPSEISGVVAFLCMAPASYLTGQTVAVDGGFSVNMF